MEDAASKPPINHTVDFQLGILFNRADGIDARMSHVEADIVELGRKVDAVNDNVNNSIKGVVSQVQTMLTSQTNELKPLLLDKAVDDENAKRRTERLQNQANTTSRWAAIIGVVFGVLGVVFAAVEADKAIHPTTPVAGPSEAGK